MNRWKGTDRQQERHGQRDDDTQTERWGHMCRHMRTNRQLGTYGQADSDTWTGRWGHMDRQKGNHGEEYAIDRQQETHGKTDDDT